MLESTITGKGQTTIPVDIRRLLGLKEGGKLQYAPQKDGVLIRSKKNYTWRDLQGILPKPKKALTVEEMDEAIGGYLSEKHRRIAETGSSEE